MTNVDMFDEIKRIDEIKKLKKRVKELQEINKDHQKLNGKIRQELELEKKNHAITREDVQAKDLEIGRMMEKLNKKKV
jgi:uncharacterized protein YktB (UPF0637 family)|tara:strand:- start:1517 stop:1750 length:234 start_codon:yes stop_codon:yes gene_type:complete